MGKTFNRDRSDDNIACMNARMREKQRILTLSIKPKNKPEWEKLMADMDAFYQQNEWAMDIDDYAVSKGYAPYKLTRQWPKENEMFADHIARLFAFLKQRHNKYMMEQGKMALLILKERALYNPLLAELEKELKKDEPSAPHITVHLPPVEKTPALDAHRKGTHEKNTLEQ